MARRSAKKSRKSGTKKRSARKSTSRVSRFSAVVVLVAGVAAAAVFVLASNDAKDPTASITAGTERPIPAAPAEPQVAAVPLAPKPTWQRHAMPSDVAPGQPMIAIVIDDMGLDRARSQRTADLPAPLTLAYLAYASDLDEQTSAAREAGHELMVHVPMEPGNNLDPGPNALLTKLTAAEIGRRVDWNLSQFDKFVGMNNHMGSKATSDRAAMAAVMAKLKDRGLLFLDSRTSGATVAQAEAERLGIPALRRDVFIDHDPSEIAVRAALLEIEDVARSKGHAIAIGHPKDTTIAALAEWLPDVRARGFALVPVSAVALRLGAGER
ncbi:MAG: hypothetical protein CL566_01145 [Alphaproteobacteria bacterium]|nr:hypothetical protein [Alphaproteobacteria bacterium]